MIAIRIVAVTSLLSLLALALYLPAANPPEAFLAQVREEHAVIGSSWGQQHARSIMARMLAYHHERPRHVPLMANSPPRRGAPEHAAAQQLDSIGERIAGTSYARSLDTLLILALYRFSTLVHFLPPLGIVLVAALVDGGIKRLRKASEFGVHDPEVFGLSVCAIIVALCGMCVGMVLPVTLPPHVFPLTLFTIACLANAAVANYHKAP